LTGVTRIVLPQPMRVVSSRSAATSLIKSDEGHESASMNRSQCPTERSHRDSELWISDQGFSSEELG
jgi:hypothetical protein